jgi:hypothetical protein
MTAAAKPSPADSAPATVSQDEVARLLLAIGAESMRASVGDPASKTFQAGCSIKDDGSVVDSRSDRGLDSVLPGVASTLDGLTQLPFDQTLLRRHSPRRWVAAWRIDDGRAILAEVQYRDRRDAVADIDTAVIRMVCNANIRNALAASAALKGAANMTAMVWPQVDRRASKPHSRSTLLQVSALLLVALLSAWVALFAAPGAWQALTEQQAENAGLLKTADATLVRQLSTAMATGDYGEAQAELSAFSSLGYFQRAVVTNAKGKVVAVAGDVPGVRIGDAVNPGFAAAARPLALTLGSVAHGELLIATSTAPVKASLLYLRIAAASAMVLALAATAILVLILMRRRAGSR